MKEIYYPNFDYSTKIDNFTKTKTCRFSTAVRIKHFDNFWYIVKLQIVLNLNSLDESHNELLLVNAFKNFVKEIETVKNHWIYDSQDKNRNPVDQYQGDDTFEIDYSKVFKYYNPELSYKELVELNGYMDKVF